MPTFHPILRDAIDLTPALQSDCQHLGIDPNRIADFILREAARHPVLFADTFDSLPFVFFHEVLLLSWDRMTVTAERLLHREDAYPLNDSWTRCLTAYRTATLLPYRRLDAVRTLTPHESKRAMNTYGRLVTAAVGFLKAIQEHTGVQLQEYSALPSLLEEARVAIETNNPGHAVVRMEALLSTVHKLVLQYAPQGAGGSTPKNESTPVFHLPALGKPKLLIVDDERLFAEQLAHLLREFGYDVLAIADPRTALQALVDNTFHLVITDMRMSFSQGGIDGREISLSIKQVSPRVKVIILTAYFETSLMADVGADLVLSKTDDLRDTLPGHIDSLLQQDAAPDHHNAEGEPSRPPRPRVVAVKILFLAANPHDTSPLRLDAEVRAIDQSLHGSWSRDRFQLVQHWAVQISDIQRYLLLHKPDIVHFSGHGSKSSEIILDDGLGSGKPVSARSLGGLFRVLTDGIRCVVLNSCYSERQARAIGKNIDSVVGMSRAIGDKAAIGFAAAFYEALGFGRDVQTAFELGCVRIDLEGLGDHNTPKLLGKATDFRTIRFT